MLQEVSVWSALWVMVCFATSHELRGAQQVTPSALSTGSILVANEKLADPNFNETVVLIVQHNADEGTVGLIINRRSEIPLSRVFPDIKGVLADPVYLGGPVGTDSAQALLRLSSKTEQTKHVTDDVYATGSKEAIEKSVLTHPQASKFHLYLGYAGWAPGQLETEIQMGAWSVIRGTGKIVFDSDPDSLWSRLSRESHMQIAAVSRADLNKTTASGLN
jgi:putative transcriptional regulator